MFSNMNNWTLHTLETLHDDVAVVPSGAIPAEEHPPQDGGSSPVEDYRNLSTITPTLFEMKKGQSMFFSEDMESVTSSSPASSSTSIGSWLQTTQLEDPRKQISVDSPSDMRSDYSEMPGQWQCVNCAALSSETGFWWQDENGHFLCERCSKTRSIFNVTSEKPPENKILKREHEYLLNRISPIPSRLHQRSNNLKKGNQICSNCQTSNTSLWRRSNFGETVCNACGLYYKLHKRNRPMTMRKDSIQKRKRKPKAQNPKKLLGHTLLNLKMEDNAINTPTISPHPPSYTSHLAMVNGTTSKEMESNHMIQSYNTVGQSLPSVHSPDGFSSQLSHYNFASVISRSSPLSDSYNSSYMSPSNPMLSNYGSINSSTSPTIASLLQSPHPYVPFVDNIHSSINHTSTMQSMYNM